MLRLIFTVATFFFASCSTLPKGLSHPTWQSVKTNEYLGPLSLHQCDSLGNKVLVFGGVRDDGAFNPFHNRGAIFDIEKKLWSRLSIAKESEKLKGAQIAVNQSNILIVGGTNVAEEYTNSYTIIDLDTNYSASIRTNELSGRTGHSLTTVDGKAILFGGGSNREIKDYAVFNFNTTRWKSYALPSHVKNRTSHVARALGDNLVIWGGFENNQRRNDGYILDTVSLKWQRINFGDITTPRSNAKSIVLNNSLLVFGGASSDKKSNSGFAFNIENNTWNGIEKIPDERYDKSLSIFLRTELWVTKKTAKSDVISLQAIPMPTTCAKPPLITMS